MEKDVDNDKSRAKPEEGKQPQSPTDKSAMLSSTDRAETAPGNGDSAETAGAKKAAQAKKAGNESAASGNREIPKKPGKSGKASDRKKGGGFRRFSIWLLVLLLLGAGVFAAWTFYDGQGRFEAFTRGIFAEDPKAPVAAAPTDSPEKPAHIVAAEPSASVYPENQSAALAQEEVNTFVIDAALEDINASVEALSERVADNQLQLGAQQERLRQLATTSREDWLLSEAEYLLRLANQRILTERQTRNALALLLTVDDILKELDQPDLFAVRKSLARDITNLKLAGVTDREGIYLRLDALIGAIASLDAQQEEMPIEEPVVATDQPWYGRLTSNAWQALVKMSGIVRVERVDVALDPVLLPTEVELLRLNLRLALEQAQLALMREEQAIYDVSLQKAMTYVQESFGDAPEVAVFVEDLESLSAEKVTQPLPLLGDTIKALQTYIDRWHNRFDGPSAQSDSATGGEGQ